MMFIGLSDFSFDRSVETIFTLEHRVYFFIEYTFLPLLSFILIYQISRRNTRTSEFLGVKNYIEIISKNWVELSLILILTWVAFEFRLFTENLPLIDLKNGTPICRIFSYSIFVLFALYMLSYLLYFNYNSSKETSKINKASDAIKFSVVPMFLFFNLLIMSISYDYYILRAIASFIFIVICTINLLETSDTLALLLMKAYSPIKDSKDLYQAIDIHVNLCNKLEKTKDEIDVRINCVIELKTKLLTLFKNQTIGKNDPEYNKRLDVVLDMLSRLIKDTTSINYTIHTEKLSSAYRQLIKLKKDQH